jgi:hypothetical protein
LNGWLFFLFSHQKIRQPSNIRRNPPRLIAREHARGGAAAGSGGSVVNAIPLRSRLSAALGVYVLNDFQDRCGDPMIQD